MSEVFMITTTSLKLKETKEAPMMKMSIALFIVFVCYIANTEQAQVALPQHNYPIPGGYYQHQRNSHLQSANSGKQNDNTKAQVSIPTNPQELVECVNMNCEHEGKDIVATSNESL